MVELLPVTDGELALILRANARFHRGLPDGRRAILQDRDLSGLQLCGLNFSQADISGSRLARVNASDANFTGVTAAGCDFSDADLSRADFTRATLCGSRLRGAVLHDAVFLQADLRPGYLAKRAMGGVFERREIGGASAPSTTDLTGAHMVGANLRRAQLGGIEASGTDFMDAVMTRANLRGAKLSSARFDGSILEGVVLDDADLRDADFGDAVLLDVDLGRANTDRAKLKGTLRQHPVGRTLPMLGDMDKMLTQHRLWLESLGEFGRRLDLSNSDLRGSDQLRGALASMGDLTRVVLYQIDLTGFQMHAGTAVEADFRLADLTDADLRGSDLTGARFGRVNGFRANLSALPTGGGPKPTKLAGASFRYADFRDANFSDADLRGADFRHADLTRADLTGAILDGADFTAAIGATDRTRRMRRRGGTG